MKFHLPRIFVVAGIASLIGTSASADTQDVIFTFEQFAAPVSGPLTNVAPEVGVNSFHADFTTPNSMIYAAGAVGGLTGNALVATSNSLQVTLSAAVSSISFSFAGQGGNFSLTFNSAAGATTVTSSPIAPGVKGGTLSFADATKSFTSFTLTSTMSGWALDNLVFRLVAAPGGPVPAPVPEGNTTIALLGVGAASLAIIRRRCLTA